MSAIVDFLEGSGPDNAGRPVNEVLAFGLGALESRHDFIQWLFPLAEASRAVPGSPILKAAEIQTLKASALAQANLAAARKRMAWFYEWTDHWLQPGDHNHLRITRIIKSQRLLVGDAEADQFRARILAKVSRLDADLSQVTRQHWAGA